MVRTDPYCQDCADRMGPATDSIAAERIGPPVPAALDLAKRAHAGQIRKDGRTPAINHSAEVAAILVRFGANRETVAAGLLHDVIEDTDVGAAEIEAVVGADVLRLVEEASEPDKSLSWRERKEHTISTLPEISADGKRLVAADKIANLRSLAAEHEIVGDELWGRFKAPKQDQAWYFRSIVATLAPLGEPIFDELKRTAESVFGADAIRVPAWEKSPSGRLRRPPRP